MLLFRMHARNASPPRDLRLAGTSFVRRRFARWTCACPIRRIRLVRLTACPRLRGRANRGWQVWPVSMRYGLWVVVTTDVSVRYRAAVLYRYMDCDLDTLNKLNMLLRTWLLLVRSMWLIEPKTIILVLPRHPIPNRLAWQQITIMSV